MKTDCNDHQRAGLARYLAVLALCAMLVCGQIVTAAHEQAHCEQEQCSLCIGSSSDSALVYVFYTDPSPQCEQQLDSHVSTNTNSTPQPTADFIRGPPDN